MHAMILAAGRGERMRPLTDHCPKPLLEVGGKPLIVWHIERLAAAGVLEIAINHAHLGQMIEDALGDGSRWGVRIRYSPEAQALETAGGIRTALPLLGDAPFAVVNGDVWCDYDFVKLVEVAGRLADEHLDCWCLLVDNPAHNPSGDFALDATGSSDHRLRNTGSSRLTYSGIGVYSPDLFAHLVPNQRAPLAPLLRQAADTDRAGGQRLTGRWVDVGTPERLAELDATLRTAGVDRTAAAADQVDSRPGDAG